MTLRIRMRSLEPQNVIDSSSDSVSGSNGDVTCRTPCFDVPSPQSSSRSFRPGIRMMTTDTDYERQQVCCSKRCTSNGPAHSPMDTTTTMMVCPPRFRVTTSRDQNYAYQKTERIDVVRREDGYTLSRVMHVTKRPLQYASPKKSPRRRPTDHLLTSDTLQALLAIDGMRPPNSVSNSTGFRDGAVIEDSKPDISSSSSSFQEQPNNSVPLYMLADACCDPAIAPIEAA